MEKVNTVIFDLGNTLVRYYRAEEGLAMLERATLEAADCLSKHSLLSVSIEEALSFPHYANPDERDIVHPLSGRLRRIFKL